MPADASFSSAPNMDKVRVWPREVVRRVDRVYIHIERDARREEAHRPKAHPRRMRPKITAARRVGECFHEALSEKSVACRGKTLRVEHAQVSGRRFVR